MIIAPGGTAIVHFNVTLQGDLSDVGNATFTVLRNGVATSIVPTISQDIVGHYTVSYDVPSNWIGYDVTSVRMQLEYGLGANPKTIACTKSVGVIGASGIDDQQEQTLDFIADLLQADQVVDSNAGKVYYYLKNSGQGVLLHEQDLTGNSSCTTDVSLISP